MSLHSRVALVTGGAVGIGRAVAKGLALAGTDVAVTYRGHDPADVLEEIEKLGRRAIAIKLDVTDPRAVEEAVDDVTVRLGDPSIVVANAGGLIGRVAVADMSDDHWSEVIETNLTAAFYLARTCLKYVARPAGRFVLMSSMAAYTGGSFGAAAYAAAKAGIVGLTKALAKELAPYGATVNGVAPGLILGTPFHETFTPPDDQERAAANLLVGRAGRPDDVAAVVMYLVSEAASFMTGEVIQINGGQQL